MLSDPFPFFACTQYWRNRKRVVLPQQGGGRRIATCAEYEPYASIVIIYNGRSFSMINNALFDIKGLVFRHFNLGNPINKNVWALQRLEGIFCNIGLSLRRSCGFLSGPRGFSGSAGRNNIDAAGAPNFPQLVFASSPEATRRPPKCAHGAHVMAR